MSKKSSTNKEERIVAVATATVGADPHVPNVRGPVRDTTDLQKSIRQAGILMPLIVRQAPPEDESEYEYYVVAGHRRLTAARALRLEEIPVIVRQYESDEAIRRASAISNIQVPMPDVVIDKQANPIGGMAYVVLQAQRGGTSLKDIAQILGLTPDTAGAYFRLCEPVDGDQEQAAILAEARRRMARGDLAITVWSRMKRAPQAAQRHILDNRKGVITVAYVKDVLRSQRYLAPESEAVDDDDRAPAAPTGDDQDAGGPGVVTYDDYMAGGDDAFYGLLHDARAALRRCAQMGMTPDETQLYTLEEIRDLAVGLIEGAQ